MIARYLLRSGVCLSSCIWYPAICSPKGYGSGFAAAQGQRRAFLTITFSYPGRARAVIVRHPILLLLEPPDKRKRNNRPRQKKNTFCLARPALPRRGPKLHLDLHPPFLHHWGLRSRVLARGFDPPRSLWALRSAIALLLSCRPRSRSAGLACLCPEIRGELSFETYLEFLKICVCPPHQFG